MSTQSIQTVQNTAKCPHGFPVGTCPICSGMGGGASKDKNKPRVPGEMSYNECMAAWMKIQAAKEARIQERIDRIEASKQNLIENRILQGLDKVDKVLNKILEPLPQVIKAPIKAVVVVVLNIIAKIPVVVQNIQNFISNTMNFIQSTTEKLVSIFGEVKNFVGDFFKDKFKKAKEKLKTILSFFTETNEEGEEGESREKIKNILKTIFKIKGDKKEGRKKK